MELLKKLIYFSSSYVYPGKKGNYNEQDLAKLDRLENQYNAKLITTEKDYLRISAYTRKKYEYIKIDIKFEEEEIFKNKIEKILK